MFGGCSDRRGRVSYEDLAPEKGELKGVVDRLHGVSRQVARTDHQLIEVSDMVATSKKDMDTAMEVAARQSANVMGHVDSVKDSIQTAQSSFETRLVAIESRLNLVECCIENSKKKVLEELDGVTASLTEKLNMEVQKLGSSVHDIGRRLGEAEVVCREAKQLDHRVGEVETICRQATLRLGKVTERRDDGIGIQRRFSAWYTTVDHQLQQASELRRTVLSETSLTCAPHVEADACLDMKLPKDRATEERTRVSGWQTRGSKNRDHSCPADSLKQLFAANPCAATVPAFPVQVATGRITARPHA